MRGKQDANNDKLKQATTNLTFLKRARFGKLNYFNLLLLAVVVKLLHKLWLLALIIASSEANDIYAYIKSLYCTLDMYRSRHRRCSIRKGILKFL